MTKRTVFLAALLALTFTFFANAQLVTLTSTTLSSAITNKSTVVCLNAATGVVVESQNGPGSTLFIEQETMRVRDVTSTSTCFNVVRTNRPVSHASGKTVYIGAANKFFVSSPAAGSCTLASTAVDPWINTLTGDIYRCVSSQWIRIGGPSQAVTAQWCGTTNTCDATSTNLTVKIVSGISAAMDAASPALATITGISPAFTSTTTYACTGTIEGAAAQTNVLATANLSASSFKFVGPNGSTDKIHYTCVGY